MERSEFAIAASAAPLPSGIAMKDTSNHMGVQHMEDPANIFATPVRSTLQHSDNLTTRDSVQNTWAGGNTALASPRLSALNDHMQAQGETGGRDDAHVPCGTATLDTSQEAFGNLDTPARPVVDHGIESNMRDTVGMSSTENGLFKVESLPQQEFIDMGVREALLDKEELPISHDVPDSVILANPSTPSNPQGAFAASPTVAEEEPSVHQAYAMLKFPDSYYYIKSTNVMITRDENYRRAWRESQKERRRKTKMQRRAQQTLDDYAREPSHHSQYGGDDHDEDLVGRPAHGLLSTYSDVGGAVSYVDPNDYGFESSAALVQRSRRSKNNSSSNHSIAPRSLHEFEHGDELEGDLYHDREGRAHDPHEWAQVAIHPQDPRDIEKISREHLIIRYDGDKRSWVMDVVGNRVLHNGQLCNRGETDIDLCHDDEIIIISVSFRFMLPIDEEQDVIESVEYDEDELETVRRTSDTMDAIESGEDGDSSEEDVPLALQHKPKKSKGKKPKSKEHKPKLVKLKLTNKNASKKVEATGGIPDLGDKKEKSKGKAPAKTGGKAPAKTGGKVPTKATETTTKEGALEEPVAKAEPDTSKPTDEAPIFPSTEAVPSEGTQPPQPTQPTQASPPAPPAPINLDANSAFAGADPSQLPQKRKGPGRPPKNGLISKRDDAGVKRKLKEYERQGLAPPPMNELLELVRAEQRQKDAAAKAASRGEAAPDLGVNNVDQRMQSYSMAYSSATPSQPQQSLPAGNGTPHELPTARSTSPRPRRPAKSPSPMPAQETFSEEQLKKPTITYVFIIDEILQDPALDGQADLQTIYDKIQKRWPYFKYGTSTNGWQSSVRHNLLQCPRFVESGKSGKGKYWKINFEHELDPKKRKQATPPPPAMSRNGLGAPPFSQPYNGSYPQGGHMYQSPYNAGAYPAASSAGSTQMQPMGQATNGQYTQPAYGQQPNGARPSTQQPPTAQPQQPQPFATIVQAIVAYRAQLLQPHGGRETYAQAEKQFEQALNHYSELHAGNTPPTEGQIDETQDPFKTMKQIFIQYGQGDTRGSHNGQAHNTTPAASAPHALAGTPATPVPGAATSVAPVVNGQTTNTSTVVTNSVPEQTTQGAASRAPSTSTPAPSSIVNGASTSEQASSQQHRNGPANTNSPQQSLAASSSLPSVVPSPSQQSQPAPALLASVPPVPSQQHRPSVTTSQAMQLLPSASTPAPSRQSQLPAAMPSALTQSFSAPTQGVVLQTSTSPKYQPTKISPMVKPAQVSQHVVTTSTPLGQQHIIRPAAIDSSSSAVSPVMSRPQQSASVANAQLPTTPTQQQPQIANDPDPPMTRPRDQPLMDQQVMPNVVVPEQKPLQPGASTSVPKQNVAPVHDSGLAGKVQPPTLAPTSELTASSADQKVIQPTVIPNVRPPVADVARLTDAEDDAQQAQGLKTQPAVAVLDQDATMVDAAPEARPASASIKRSAEEDGQDQQAKRPKTSEHEPPQGAMSPKSV